MNCHPRESPIHRGRRGVRAFNEFTAGRSNMDWLGALYPLNSSAKAAVHGRATPPGSPPAAILKQEWPAMQGGPDAGLMGSPGLLHTVVRPCAP